MRLEHHSPDEFKTEFDARATSRGCKLLYGGSHADMEWHGYIFGAKMLQYAKNGDQLKLRVCLQGPQSALTAAVQHALNPGLSANDHEERLKEDLNLEWSNQERTWFLKTGRSELIGMPGRTAFDNETLAQSCVNWLCTNTVPGLH